MRRMDRVPRPPLSAVRGGALGLPCCCLRERDAVAVLATRVARVWSALEQRQLGGRKTKKRNKDSNTEEVRAETHGKQQWRAAAPLLPLPAAPLLLSFFPSPCRCHSPFCCSCVRLTRRMGRRRTGREGEKRERRRRAEQRQQHTDGKGGAAREGERLRTPTPTHAAEPRL
jgi:hypothetical protein